MVRGKRKMRAGVEFSGQQISSRISPQLLYRLARLLGGIVFFIGLLVLVGWILDIQVLKSIQPNLVTMKVNTAIGFVLGGAALWLYAPFIRKHRLRFALHRLCALAVGLIGLLTLIQHLYRVDFGIDQLLIPEPPLESLTAVPGRMAISSAINFMLVGGAVVMRDRLPAFSRMTLYVVLLLSMLAIMGFAFGVESLYATRIYTSMAVHTATLFLLLSLGLLICRPEEGLIGLLTQNSAGSVAGRRLVVVTPMLLIILGLLRNIGAELNWYSDTFGIALMVSLSIAVMGVMIAWTVGVLHRIDHERLTALHSLEVERQQLRDSDEQLRSTVYSLPVAIVLVAEGGRISLVNSATERLFGYRREELLGESVDKLIPARFEAVHGRLRGNFGRPPVGNPEALGSELFGRKKDGSEFPIELGLTPIRTRARHQVLGSVLDLTERRRAQELIEKTNRLLEDQVAQRTRSLQEANARLSEATTSLTQSNRDLEQFAYVASHDLQEPLRGITGCADLLATKYRDQFDEPALELLQHILNGSERMRNLVQGLLTFAQLESQAGPKVDVDLGELVDTVLTSLGPLLAESGGEVTRESLPLVKADTMQLELVLQNLISNGLKFRGDSPPRVHLSAEEREDSWAISVADNGIGIESDHFDRIFKFFQRLHDRQTYPGTGIGLAIAKRVIEGHGGEFIVESTPGEGAKFTFTLAKPPVAKKASSQQENI